MKQWITWTIMLLFWLNTVRLDPNDPNSNTWLKIHDQGQVCAELNTLTTYQTRLSIISRNSKISIESKNDLSINRNLSKERRWNEFFGSSEINSIIFARHAETASSGISIIFGLDTLMLPSPSQHCLEAASALLQYCISTASASQMLSRP